MLIEGCRSKFQFMKIVKPVPNRFQNRREKSDKKVDVESAAVSRAFEAQVSSSGQAREFRTVFRAARLLGLFPVSGLNSNDRTAELAFR